MSKPIQIAIIANGSQAQREARKVASDYQSFGQKMSSIGSRVARASAVAATAAAAGLAKLGKDSINAASDAQQSLGATKSVFGKYADTVIKRSAQAANSIGLSANEYRELSNVTGAMLSSAGTPLAKVTDLTDNLNRRAADMAATFGGTTREAVESVTALLRGETDPIEKYGVAIKQSDINARLASKGLDKLTGSALKQAEQQARLELLFKQTARTQGQFGRESDTLAGKQQRLTAEWDNLKVKIGNQLLPVASDLTDWGRRELLPMIERIVPKIDDWVDSAGDLASEVADALAPAWDAAVDAFSDTGDEVDTVRGIFDALLPVLRTSSQLVAAVVKAYDALPGPLKDLAIQGAAAAYVLPRLTAAAGFAAAGTTGFGARVSTARVGVAGFARDIRAMSLEYTNVSRAQSLATSAMSNTTGAAHRTRAALQQLSGAARTVAGVGGLVLLSKSANEANESMRALEKTAGAVLTGFAVGGPVGAGVGLVAGVASSFKELQQTWANVLGVGDQWRQKTQEAGTAADATAAAVKRYKAAVESLSATLNNGQTTSDTTAAAWTDVRGQLTALGYSSENVRASLQALGLSHRTVALAATGDAAAIRAVNQAYATAPLDKRIIGEHTFADAVDHARVATNSAMAAERRRMILAQDWTGKLNAFPKQVATEIKLNGVMPTVKGIAVVAKRYNLTPRQVRTLINVTGVQASVKDVRKVQRGLDDVRKSKPKAKVDADTKSATKKVKSLNDLTKAFLKKGGTAKVDANTKPAQVKLKSLQDILKQVNKTKVSPTVKVPNPTKDINTVRSNLKRIPDEDVWVNVHRRTVGGGGGSSSSSDRGTPRTYDTEAYTTETTDDMARALSRSVTEAAQRAAPAARRAGRDIVSKLLRGVAGGKSAIDKALERITELVRKRINLKNDAAEAARERRVLTNLRDQYRALVLNGRAQDKINKKLEAARGHLAEVKSWADGVRDSFVATGNITNLGQSEDGTVSGTQMLDQMRTAVVRAERFAVLIRQLRAAGLNKTSLDQMLAAGPEAALATAEALAAGGSAALTEVNQLTSRLNAEGASLGREMSKTFFTVGLSAAEGIVAGLERQQAKLERAAQRIADALAAKVRKALGIKSPSTVFKGIGDNVVDGLVIGLDDTHVRRQGAALASSLRDGFARPALEAYARDRAAAGDGRVRITLTAQELSQLQRGREIQADLDAYRRAGGRAAS